MGSPWIDYVKQYQRENGCSYHDALKQAGPSWKESKHAAKIRDNSQKKRARFEMRRSNKETGARGGGGFSVPYTGSDGLPWNQKRMVSFAPHIRGAPTDHCVSVEQNRRRRAYIQHLEDAERGDVDQLFQELGLIIGGSLRQKYGTVAAESMGRGLVAGGSK